MTKSPSHDIIKYHVGGRYVALRILFCDDDSKILAQLQKYVCEYFEKGKLKRPEMKVYVSGEELLKAEQKADIAFLDVEMPGRSGIYVGAELMKRNPRTKIVIVTSYPDYLDEAMRFRVFRYLSKPINKNRLFENLKDAIYQYNIESIRIPVETKDGVVTLSSEDIICLEGQKRGTKICTVDGDLISVKGIQSWQEELKIPSFYASYRNYIINMKYVVYYMIKEYPKASAVMNELSAFLDFDEKTARFDTPECVQLLENMYDFAFAPDSDYTTSGSDNFSDYFAVYNSVPSPSLAFPVGYPKETVNDPKPFALENGDVLLEKFCTLAIPTESKNAENAWTYIDFVTGDLTEYIDNVTAWSYSINRAYDRNLTVLMLQRQFNFTEEEAESALENFDAIMEKYNAIPTIDDRLYASLYETVNAYLTADKAPAEETAAKLQASAEQYFAE